MLRILIADDHAIVRRGLKNILLEEFPSAEIFEASNAEELVSMVIKSQFNIVVSDLSMPGRSGLEALQQIKIYAPKLPVLILSMYPEEQYAVRVLKAGAAGYLNKDLAPDQLVKAINHVLSGRKYITPNVAESLASNIDLNINKLSHQELSDREFEVLKLLATGKSITEISSALKVSVTTISTYRSRILVKMNMRSNAEMIQYAIEHKLV